MEFFVRSLCNRANSNTFFFLNVIINIMHKIIRLLRKKLLD